MVSLKKILAVSGLGLASLVGCGSNARINVAFAELGEGYVCRYQCVAPSLGKGRVDLFKYGVLLVTKPVGEDGVYEGMVSNLNVSEKVHMERDIEGEVDLLWRCENMFTKEAYDIARDQFEKYGVKEKFGKE